MLIFNSNNLTIQIVRRLNLTVFTWSGTLSSESFVEGTIQSLEVLREHRSVHRVVMNAREITALEQKDVDASVKSTVDYLGITRANYRMSVVSPLDARARETINFYIDALNTALKKRFIVKQHRSVKEALSWLKLPKACTLF
ncbi:MAG TPA: hypothetical protein VKQ08_00200 [Cyclobacteriaceae bacterium]|nr:hypothetical protein [Cyclobacteriaceae bacterium]